LQSIRADQARACERSSRDPASASGHRYRARADRARVDCDGDHDDVYVAAPIAAGAAGLLAGVRTELLWPAAQRPAALYNSRSIGNFDIRYAMNDRMPSPPGSRRCAVVTPASCSTHLNRPKRVSSTL